MIAIAVERGTVPTAADKTGLLRFAQDLKALRTVE